VKKAKIVLTFCTSIIKLGNLSQIGQMKDLQPAQRFSKFGGSVRIWAVSPFPNSFRASKR